MATADGFGVVVNLTLEDLDELLGFGAAEANHSKDARIAKQLYKLHGRLHQIEQSYTDEPMDRYSPQSASSERARFTSKQGQYLTFIHYYTKIHGMPPAESEMQRYFKVSPPAVHQMICALEQNGLIERVPGRARTVRVLVPREELPDLE